MYLEDTYSTEAVDGNMLLFAVFDGHGGSKASEFCQNHLLNNIRRHINPAKERNPTGAMKAGFLQTEMQFRSLAEQLGWTDGTTAVVMCLCDGWIHVAHVGDSRLVLTRDGHPPSCQALTEDHKPDNHHEYQLIHSRGGQVQQRLGDVSRVVPGYLAVSRSIGDIRAKPVVSAEPEINSFKLPSNTRALVLASDGLWDVVSNQMVADICARCTNARQATDMLVETALQMRSTDNVTALVVFP
jgi:protein phosphatase 1L